MKDQSRPYPGSHLFTLRLWSEAIGEHQVEWRGQVQHVVSGKVRYFRGWTALIPQLRAMIAELETNGATNGEELPS